MEHFNAIINTLFEEYNKVEKQVVNATHFKGAIVKDEKNTMNKYILLGSILNTIFHINGEYVQDESIHCEYLEYKQNYQHLSYTMETKKYINIASVNEKTGDVINILIEDSKKNKKRNEKLIKKISYKEMRKGNSVSFDIIFGYKTLEDLPF